MQGYVKDNINVLNDSIKRLWQAIAGIFVILFGIMALVIWIVI